MKFGFKTLLEFTEYFHNDEVCVEHFKQTRFADGEYCPHCKHGKVWQFKGRKRYRCASVECNRDFSIKTNTLFEDSKISIRKWYMAMYLISSAGKGISSVQLAKQIGVTQKTAWYLDHRIRAAMKHFRLQK